MHILFMFGAIVIISIIISLIKHPKPGEDEDDQGS